MTEIVTPTVSRLAFMKLVSGHINMPRSELEHLLGTPAFSPYDDAQCEEGDGWRDDD